MVLAMFTPTSWEIVTTEPNYKTRRLFPSKCFLDEEISINFQPNLEIGLIEIYTGVFYENDIDELIGGSKSGY